MTRQQQPDPAFDVGLWVLAAITVFSMLAALSAFGARRPELADRLANLAIAAACAGLGFSWWGRK